MTEAQFFRRAALGATAVTVAALVVDRALSHDPPEVLPFGEPWLTIVGCVGMWLAVLVVSHLARWICLIVRRREPDLGE